MYWFNSKQTILQWISAEPFNIGSSSGEEECFGYSSFHQFAFLTKLPSTFSSLLSLFSTAITINVFAFLLLFYRQTLILRTIVFWSVSETKHSVSVLVETTPNCFVWEPFACNLLIYKSASYHKVHNDPISNQFEKTKLVASTIMNLSTAASPVL